MGVEEVHGTAERYIAVADCPTYTKGRWQMSTRDMSILKALNSRQSGFGEPP
jgi:hypothetical protein